MVYFQNAVFQVQHSERPRCCVASLWNSHVENLPKDCHFCRLWWIDLRLFEAEAEVSLVSSRLSWFAHWGKQQQQQNIFPANLRGVCHTLTEGVTLYDKGPEGSQEWQCVPFLEAGWVTYTQSVVLYPSHRVRELSNRIPLFQLSTSLLESLCIGNKTLKTVLLLERRGAGTP